MLYVPDFKVFGGSVGFLGVAGFGAVCGQIRSASPSTCRSGFGVISYDIPEFGTAIKFKARGSVFAYNTAMITAFYLTIAKKLD